jgi:signal transduction histidine kinase
MLDGDWSSDVCSSDLRNARRLGNSIDNVLELSIVATAEAGREKVRLKGMLDSVCGQYAPVAALKGLKLTLDAREAVVEGDAKMLRLAVANLVDNAIKFTEKGSVGISLKAAGGSVSISVKDTGIGISAKDQKRVFEKFFKADPAAPGTGIGLAIAKEIVNKHNGEIRLRSSPGKGSTFEMILPRGVGK